MEDLKKTAKVIYDEDGFIDIKDTTDTNLPHEIFYVYWIRARLVSTLLSLYR